VSRAAVALGANLGDRAATLESAVGDVGALVGVEVLACSDWYETPPVGGPDGQPPYLNGVLLLQTQRSPRDLLAALQAIEAAHGRVRAERWGPRTLDLDLLAYDALVSADPELTLPHPRAHERAFVLAPWAQVDPDFVLPGSPLPRTVADLLAALPDGERAGVRTWVP
jgi:2-amino-4-hydroxy-6-hydroxymethyldihydropteridine diphosphokinase